MTHPAHARRLRLERAERELNLPVLRAMLADAERFCELPWRRDVRAALARAERRQASARATLRAAVAADRRRQAACPHLDSEDGCCLECGAWVAPYDV